MRNKIIDTIIIYYNVVDMDRIINNDNNKIRIGIIDNNRIVSYNYEYDLVINDRYYYLIGFIVGIG